MEKSRPVRVYDNFKDIKNVFADIRCLLLIRTSKDLHTLYFPAKNRELYTVTSRFIITDLHADSRDINNPILTVCDNVNKIRYIVKAEQVIKSLLKNGYLAICGLSLGQRIPEDEISEIIVEKVKTAIDKYNRRY